MKRSPLLTTLAITAITLLISTGCSEKPATQSNSATAPVQGDLIAPATPSTPEPAPNVAAKPETKPTSETKYVAAVASPAPSTESKTDGDYLTVGFDKLAAFNYAMPEESNVATNAPGEPVFDQIPSDIRSLNSKRVALKGFMLPLKVEGGLITELLIMRDQSMCCYGSVPKINEWVSVKMVGKGVKPIMDQAVTLYGALKVGEMYESGYLVGIYAMDGEKMAGPLDL